MQSNASNKIFFIDLRLKFQIYIHTFYSTISEFASLASHSETFKMKLLEHGKAIMKRNAIETGIKYFLS